MSTIEKIEEKFKRLLEEGTKILTECGWSGSKFYKFPSRLDYLRFRTESLNLIRRVCGGESEHYRELTRLAEGEESSVHSRFFPHCHGVLQAAYRDFSEDFLFDLRATVRAELLGDFIEQAKTLLEEGYHVAAASLAGAVLEDTLRKICDQRNLPYPEKTNIDALNALLAKGRAYNKLVQKEITAKADIRNNADHGKFDQFDEQDVRDMVNWVQRFASEHLK